MTVIQTYQDGNLLEDTMLEVTIVTPTDTPLLSGIAKGKATNTLHQWPVDNLTTRQDNAVVEGASITYGTVSAPSRASNQTQIFAKTFQVSSTEKWVKSAGVDDQFVYQRMKATKEIATDVELALMRGSLITGNSSTARRLAGCLNYISTNATTVVSGTKLTESFFNGQLELCWISGGSPNEAYVGSFLKRIISQFSAGMTKEISVEDKRLVNAIDVYDSDFGLQKIFKSRDMLSGTANCSLLIIENERLELAIGEPIHDLSEEEVAQTVHGENGVIRGEMTLVNRAEPVHATVKGLNNVF